MLPFFRFTRSVTPADVYAAGTVLVPLEEAHRYSHSRRQRLAQVAREDSKDPATDEEADELEGLVGGDEWDDEEESVAKQDAVDKNGANGGVTLRTAPPDRDSYDGHPRTETTVLNRDRREDGSTTEYTIEGLRREARRGEKAHWTDYERKSVMVERPGGYEGDIR